MATRSNSEPIEPDPVISDEDPQANHENHGTFEQIWDSLPLNVTDIQFRAIDLTIQGMRDTQIAQTLGLNRKTLWQWKTHDEDYRQALTLARINLQSTTSDRCQTIAQKATTVLANFLNEDVEDKNRLRAAQILLNIASRFKPVPEKRQPTPTQKEIANYYFPPPDLGPKVG
jgi:DNA-binding CsgD family transcriptional regulator